MDKTIYELELHEILTFEINDGYDSSVMRVAGGWIYEYTGRGDVFVPFHNEFQTNKRITDTKPYVTATETHKCLHCNGTGEINQGFGTVAPCTKCNGVGTVYE